jgi:hypothetical protein
MCAVELHCSGYSCPPKDRCPEEIQADEAVDCQVIELLRDEVLPHSHAIPREFVLKVVVLLNKGSIHSASNSTNGGEFCEVDSVCTVCSLASQRCSWMCP